MGTSRRDFVGGAIAAALAPLVDACHRAPPFKNPKTVDVASLGTDGAGMIAPISGSDGRPVLVIRLSSEHFVALSTLCTHEGCPVNPPAGGVITCPCHGSQYDLEGQVIHGPALYSLSRYPVRYDGRAHQLTVDTGA